MQLIVSFIFFYGLLTQLIYLCAGTVSPGEQNKEIMDSDLNDEDHEDWSTDSSSDNDSLIPAPAPLNVNARIICHGAINSNSWNCRPFPTISHIEMFTCLYMYS